MSGVTSSQYTDPVRHTQSRQVGSSKVKHVNDKGVKKHQRWNQSISSDFAVLQQVTLFYYVLDHDKLKQNCMCNAFKLEVQNGNNIKVSLKPRGSWLPSVFLHRVPIHWYESEWFSSYRHCTRYSETATLRGWFSFKIVFNGSNKA